MPKEISINLSPFLLGNDSNVKRIPNRCKELQYADFQERFDESTFFYDIFWGDSNNELIAICPKLGNLLHGTNIGFIALPSQAQCSFEIISLIALDEIKIQVPLGTSCVKVSIGNQIKEIIIPSRLTEIFSGVRALVTLSKNNPLIWLRDWAHYYASEHGVNAIVIYDNGSDIYNLDRISDILSGVNGLDLFSVINWNFKYGPADYRRKATLRLGEDDFCQRGALLHCFRRILPKAEAIINVDVDELIYSANSTPLFDSLRDSKTGFFKLTGHWVEVNSSLKFDFPRHKFFSEIAKNKIKTHCPHKWVVDPRRQPKYAHPLVHDIMFSVNDENSYHFAFAHFKAISTNWDYHQNLYMSNRPVIRSEFNKDLNTITCKSVKHVLDRHFTNDDPEVIPIIRESISISLNNDVKHIATDLMSCNDEANAVLSDQFYIQKLFLLNNILKLNEVLELRNLPEPFTMSAADGASITGAFDNEVYQTYNNLIKFASNSWEVLATTCHFLNLLERQDLVDEMTSSFGMLSCWTDGRLLALRSYFSMKNKKPEVALDLINQALSADSNFPGYHHLKGEILTVLRNYKDAELSYLEAIRISNFDSFRLRILSEYSKMQSKTGHVSTLALQIRYCFLTEPSIGYSRLLFKMGRFVEAFETIMTCISNKPEHHGSYILALRCISRSKNILHAEDVIEKYEKYRLFKERVGVSEVGAEKNFASFRIESAKGSILLGEFDRAQSLYGDLLYEGVNPQRLNTIVFCAADEGFVDEATWMLAARVDSKHNCSSIKKERLRIKKVQHDLFIRSSVKKASTTPDRKETKTPSHHTPDRKEIEASPHTKSLWRSRIERFSSDPRSFVKNSRHPALKVFRFFIK